MFCYILFFWFVKKKWSRYGYIVLVFIGLFVFRIGGDYFGNYQFLLPKENGRTYYECDIDTDGYHSRGSRRIVYSNDGLIYYSPDHYESFVLLYGEE